MAAAPARITWINHTRIGGCWRSRARLLAKWDARAPMTQAELAALIRCPVSWIKHAEATALAKIRNAMERKLS